MRKHYYVYMATLLLSILFLSMLPSCGNDEKDEPTPDSSIEKLIIGKWEMYTSHFEDSKESIGLEFKLDGTGTLWVYDEYGEEEGYEEDELIIGKMQYNISFLGNSSDEKVIRIKAPYFDEGPIETYLSISYITEKKIIGKMSYFDGDPMDKDDWVNVNFERVEEFHWEK